MKNFYWRYDTKIYKTKKEALKKIGSKKDFENVQDYFKAKRSITKEYYIQDGEFVCNKFDSETSEIRFDKLDASEFRVYEVYRG